MPATRRGVLLAAALGSTAGCGSSRHGDAPRVVTGAFRSRTRLGRRTGWAVAYPPGSRTGLPVLVVLHGLGNDHTTAMGRLGLDDVQADVSRHELPRFAIASVDGGTTYWHRRPSGEDAAAMVLHEFLPLLRCVAGFPAAHRPQVHYGAGGHEMSFWRRRAPAQLRFAGAHLA